MRLGFRRDGSAIEVDLGESNRKVATRDSSVQKERA